MDKDPTMSVRELSVIEFSHLERIKTRLKDLTLQFDDVKPHTAQGTQDYAPTLGLTE